MDDELPIPEGRINQLVSELAILYSDGFQLTDVGPSITTCMEMVEAIKGLTGSEKEGLCLVLFERLFFRIDLPYIPDALVKPTLWKLLKPILVGVVRMIARASKGDVRVNDA